MGPCHQGRGRICVVHRAKTKSMLERVVQHTMVPRLVEESRFSSSDALILPLLSRKTLRAIQFRGKTHAVGLDGWYGVRFRLKYTMG